jgi:hypothetical protein
MKIRNKFLKEAGIFLIATIIILTSIGTVTTAINIESSNNTLEEKATKTSSTFNSVLLDEDFSGAIFPPAGWETDYWKKSYTNYAGGIIPEANANYYDQYYQGGYYDNYIRTYAMDASACGKIVLDFKFAANTYYGQYCYIFVKYRPDPTSGWIDISPWPNPVGGNISGSYSVSINCGSGGCGNQFQVMWEFVGYYYYYRDIYLDDVKITCYYPPDIDVEKYAWDKKNMKWVDADTKFTALDAAIGTEVKFKIVIHNNGEYPLYYINITDTMHDSLEYLWAEPEPEGVYYNPPEYLIWWWFLGPLMPCDTIELLVGAQVKGPECSNDYNIAWAGGSGNGIFTEDEDYCWIHAYTTSRDVQRTFLQFLRCHPNMFPLMQNLIKKFGL